MKTYSLIIILVILFGVVIFEGITLFSLHTSLFKDIPDTVSSNISLEESKEMWANRIDEIGADSAHKEFLKKYEDRSPGVQHVLAHMFGALLYEKVELDGATVCDNSFAYGCYHEFLGTAIQMEGMDVIHMLNETCVLKLKSQALGCQHGMGHGILTTLGYDFKHLLDALYLCSTLKVQDSIGGCKGGVFMEYNLQTTLGDDGRVREIDANGLYFPCSSLDEKLRMACYFWQPQWWQVVIGDDSEDFQEIVELCEGLINENEMLQCFKGIGNNAVGVIGWDVEKMINVCSMTHIKRGSIFCRAEAASVFFAEPQYKHLALSLCDGLKDEERELCITVSNVHI